MMDIKSFFAVIAKERLKLFLVFVLLVGAFSVSVLAQSVTSGYSWSGNIGWISGNNCPDPNDTSCTQTYGVQIADDGTLSGYAWSSNLGWISFEQGSLQGCNGLSNLPCKAYADLDAKDKNGGTPIKGWARACSVFVSGCAGSLKSPSYLGDDGTSLGIWDGFIALSDTDTSDAASWGVSITPDGKQMTGYAWGAPVVGWVEMNFAVTELQKPECSDGVDNADPEDTIIDWPNDPGCDSADDPSELDRPLPTINAFTAFCVDIKTLPTMPKFSWDATGDVASCRLVRNGNYEYPSNNAGADGSKKYADDPDSISSSLVGDAQGIYTAVRTVFQVKESDLPASYTLECTGSAGTDSTATASLQVTSCSVQTGDCPSGQKKNDAGICVCERTGALPDNNGKCPFNGTYIER